jgi:hypothetical protein
MEFAIVMIYKLLWASLFFLFFQLIGLILYFLNIGTRSSRISFELSGDLRDLLD